MTGAINLDLLFWHLMNKFIFHDYNFDPDTATAVFHYAYESGPEFTEKIVFNGAYNYDEVILDRALFLAFILIGTSYYKTFPSPEVRLADRLIDAWQADFFSSVYQEGLSQFAYENNLRRHDLAHFQANTETSVDPKEFHGAGILALQSGGKDSLVTAALLAQAGQPFTPWYISSSEKYPAILDSLEGAEPLVLATRHIDHGTLKLAAGEGGLNGHVPITYIVQSLALIQAILLNKNYILASIGHEGEEAHAWIDDLAVNHQWSKTWSAEQQFADYVKRYISPDIHIGSPLRAYSELKVSELFAQHGWERYGHLFSSCNEANYRQGNNNTLLQWCGRCSKCANSYLLFAPFVESGELKSLFGDTDLFTVPVLEEVFKGLLGVDGVMKPFECIGEIDELRFAYHVSQQKDGFLALPFDVPASDFSYNAEHSAQSWAVDMLK